MTLVKFLCDTSIISELSHPHPNKGVVEWASGVSAIALSVITLEEICYGLTWKPNSRIQTWFEDFIENHCQVFPVAAEIAQRAGELRAQLQWQGKPRSQADMTIAATAQIHRLTIVTRNNRDFEGCDISLLNPFC